jgi:sugar (pentulose or hexulose) kinase
MVHETRAFLPDANNHRIYMEIYEKAYSRIYGKLQPIYRSLNDIYKRR